MATLNWSQIVEVSRAEAKQSLLTLLDGVGFTATSWQPFSVPAALVEIGAEIWHRGSLIAVAVKEAIFSESATGEALTRFSRSHYQNERIAAVAEQRRIRLRCATGEGPHSIDLGDMVIAHPDGDTYRNIEGLGVVYPETLPSGGTLTLLFEAEIAGAAAHKANGTVTTIVTTLSGVTVDQDTSEVTGADEESDERLRERNDTQWALLTQFELIEDAVRNIILTAVPGIRSVAVDATNPRGPGTFDVYVAAETTPAAPGDVTLAQAALDPRVMGMPGTGLVYAAAEVPISPAGTIYYDPSFDSADVQTAVEGGGPGIEGALTSFVKVRPLGGDDFVPGFENTLNPSDLAAAIKNTAIGGLYPVRTVVLTNPAAPLAVPSFGKLVVGTLNLTYVPISA